MPSPAPEEGATPPQPAWVSIGKYLRDAGTFGLAQQILKLSSLITLPIITKKLGVDQYGILALANTFAGFLVWFVLWSFPSGIIRLLAGERDRHRVSQVHATALLLIVGSGLAWYAIAFPFVNTLAGSFFGGPEYAILIHLAILTTIFTSAVSLLMSPYRIKGENARYTRIDVTFSLMATGLTILVLLLVDNAIPVFAALLFFKGIRSLWLLRQFVKAYGWARPCLRSFRPYLRFCLPLLVPQVMSWSMTLSDRLFIGYYYDITQVGIYSASYNLPVFVNQLVSALFFSFTPVFARLWNEGDHDRLRHFYRTTANILLGVGLPMVVGMSVLCGPLMSLLTTPEVGATSWRVVPFVAASYLCVGLAGYGSDVYLNLRRTGITGLFSTGAALINLGANFVLIPRYGILGAAMATLGAYAALAVTIHTRARREFHFTLDGGFAIKVLFASAGMGLLLWFFRPENPWHVVWLIPLGVLSYAAFLYVFTGRPGRGEILRFLGT